jgi:hypothetical protein
MIEIPPCGWLDDVERLALGFPTSVPEEDVFAHLEECPACAEFFDSVSHSSIRATIATMNALRSGGCPADTALAEAYLAPAGDLWAATIREHVASCPECTNCWRMMASVAAALDNRPRMSGAAARLGRLSPSTRPTFLKAHVESVLRKQAPRELPFFETAWRSALLAQRKSGLGSRTSGRSTGGAAYKGRAGRDSDREGKQPTVRAELIELALQLDALAMKPGGTQGTELDATELSAPMEALLQAIEDAELD